MDKLRSDRRCSAPGRVRVRGVVNIHPEYSKQSRQAQENNNLTSLQATERSQTRHAALGAPLRLCQGIGDISIEV